MAQRTLRTGLTGSALMRLLAGLTDPQVRWSESRAAFADGLSQWTGWADAIALSAALDRPLAKSPTSGDEEPFRYEEAYAEYQRVRALLARAIVREATAVGRSPLDAGLGFSPYRQCYVARQQAMDVAIGPLREQVRAALAAGTPELARLAAVDTVMAQVLSNQERRLLATVPLLLEKHFGRLRAAQVSGAGDGPGFSEDGTWLDLFRQDLQAVLLAELELRLQPVEGLVEA
ncbi:MAG: DUF3348 domain-containing protein, partial [Burkholderiaceae bacterium]